MLLHNAYIGSRISDHTGTIKLFENSLFPGMTSEDVMDQPSSEAELIENTIEALHEHMSGYGIRCSPFTPQKAPPILPPMILGLSVVAAEYLPKPRKLPFFSFMDVVSVYRNLFGSFRKCFSKCHLGEMKSPAFISGNWMGYYTDIREARDQHDQTQIGPPTRDICTIASPSSEHDMVDIHVSTQIDTRRRGLDLHGEFTLEDKIRENGEVYMVKRYIGHNWALH
jgi:hypothetical protein